MFSDSTHYSFVTVHYTFTNCCGLIMQYLRQKNAELEEKYKDTEVPMPDYWLVLHRRCCQIDSESFILLAKHQIKTYIILFLSFSQGRIHCQA